jgi:phage baseplate assembly protein W
MAVVHPLDLNKNKAVGLKYPIISDNKNSFGLNYTTNDQIKTNLLNFILTNEGERIMMASDYGFGANKLLFENEETVGTDLKERLISKIQKWLPYISVTDVTINVDSINGHQINIAISFTTFVDPSVQDQLQFSLIVEE